MTVKQIINVHQKVSKWIREQFTQDGYKNGDPVDHKQLVVHMIHRKKHEITAPAIALYAIEFLANAIAHRIYKRPGTNKENADEQVSFEFYSKMGVEDHETIELLLDFGDKRVFDPKDEKFICLYEAVKKEDRALIRRVAEYLHIKSDSIEEHSKILWKIDKRMEELGIPINEDEID